ncbi:hypothetical protein LV457_17590 [Mycobacterium sp. MYCO198283]|uniref:hypothetical protein n=1 Tax=Mycobacterium sp. MYCO198283 TaxID=2883505 RepID=UPI001E4CE4B2|nr:hypothetical protein [Mycobacterium sp. MYCO198283]MCG5434088.1 hypothetical protein [Mycobacterium sp. MYCO198283]
MDFRATTPLIGMTMVFLAMGIVAVTAYLHVGWWSAVGYAIAAAIAVFGFVFTFRDVPNPPIPVPQAMKTDDAIDREQ